MSFVSRSTARSTGRLSAIAIGVRPAPFNLVQLGAVVGQELDHLAHFRLGPAVQADRDVHRRVARRRHHVDVRIDLVRVRERLEPGSRRPRPSARSMPSCALSAGSAPAATSARMTSSWSARAAIISGVCSPADAAAAAAAAASSAHRRRRLRRARVRIGTLWRGARARASCRRPAPPDAASCSRRDRAR